MPSLTIIEGNVGVGQQLLPGATEPVDVIAVQTSPFEQVVIPLPDESGPNGEPSARELLKRHLNSGVVIATTAPGRPA